MVYWAVDKPWVKRPWWFQLLSTWVPAMIRLGCGRQISAHPSLITSIYPDLHHLMSHHPPVTEGWLWISRQLWPLAVLHPFMSTVLLCLFTDAWHLRNCKPNQSSSPRLQELLMGVSDLNVCIKLSRKSVCCGNPAWNITKARKIKHLEQSRTFGLWFMNFPCDDMANYIITNQLFASSLNIHEMLMSWEMALIQKAAYDF